MNLIPARGGMLLGYARTSTGGASLESQIDALTGAGVDPARIYTDGAGAHGRPGWFALLDYARAGDTAVVVGIDRLGRTVTEVLTGARALTDRSIGLRSLREGVDTSDPAGSMVVGVLASLSVLDEQSPARRHAATASVGRPRALDDRQIASAQRMRANGQSVQAIAESLGVSRATLYRTLAERRSVR